MCLMKFVDQYDDPVMLLKQIVWIIDCNPRIPFGPTNVTTVKVHKAVQKALYLFNH